MAEDKVTSTPLVITPPAPPVLTPLKPVVTVQPPVVSQPAPKPHKKTAKLADLEAALKRK
jgi:hypothetical protein